jgi:hypothetical protein
VQSQACKASDFQEPGVDDATAIEQTEGQRRFNSKIGGVQRSAGKETDRYRINSKQM